MRKNLLESFDKIYILDLHGNAKKKEVCPDGSADQNVFDIMQGVSINIFVKTGKKNKTELGKVFHSNLQGKREFKYDSLNDNTINSFDWIQLDYTYPNLFFVPKNFEEIESFELGFKIDDLFNISASGIETGKDNLVYSEKNEELNIIRDEFLEKEDEFLNQKYNLSKDKVKQVKDDIKNSLIIFFNFTF
jgi:predicted helicase